MISITTEPIDYCMLTEAVRDRAAGAVVLFLGTVREVTRGVQTDFLTYEAFPEMAIRSMQELAEEAKGRFQVIQIAICHRTGILHPGEISVAIAVSSAHRKQACAAGEWLIDTLKERVPVWKKEHYSDGRVEWQHPGLTMTTQSE